MSCFKSGKKVNIHNPLSDTRARCVCGLQRSAGQGSLYSPWQARSCKKLHHIFSQVSPDTGKLYFYSCLDVSPPPQFLALYTYTHLYLCICVVWVLVVSVCILFFFPSWAKTAKSNQNRKNRCANNTTRFCYRSGHNLFSTLIAVASASPQLSFCNQFMQQQQKKVRRCDSQSNQLGFSRRNVSSGILEFV